jgi:hypothetical protein
MKEVVCRNQREIRGSREWNIRFDHEHKTNVYTQCGGNISIQTSQRSYV